MFRGQYMLDSSKGLDFLRWRQQKVKPLKEILSVVRREVDTIPGVLRTEDPDIVDNGSAIKVSMIVVLPDDDKFRVVIDEFGDGLAAGLNRSGVDPVTTAGSTLPIVIIGVP